jgi:hypothetical protein
MSLLACEILLAIVAIQRGWRVAALLLVALPAISVAYAQAAGVALGLAHGLSLVGLIVACRVRPVVGASFARRLGRPALRHTGSLYQI